LAGKYYPIVGVWQCQTPTTEGSTTETLSVCGSSNSFGSIQTLINYYKWVGEINDDQGALGIFYPCTSS